MLKYSAKKFIRNINFFKLTQMNFRDARELRHQPSDKYIAGKMHTPYTPQFSLTEVEKQGNILNNNLTRKWKITCWRKNNGLG